MSDRRCCFNLRTDNVIYKGPACVNICLPGRMMLCRDSDQPSNSYTFIHVYSPNKSSEKALSESDRIYQHTDGQSRGRLAPETGDKKEYLSGRNSFVFI